MAELSKNKFQDELLRFVEEEQDPVAKGQDVDNYDAKYELIQKQRQIIQGGKIDDQRGVRYMDKIREATEKRKREQSINFEKVAAKQLQREGKSFEGTQKFLTQTYLEMLEKNKKFEVEDQQKEEWNNQHSAANKQDMSNFYKRMFNQNMIYGGFGTADELLNPATGPDAQKQPEFSLSLGFEPEETPEIQKPQARERSRSRDRKGGEEPKQASLVSNTLQNADTEQEPKAAKLDNPQESEVTGPTKPAQEPVLSREEKIRLAKEKRRERLETQRHQ